MEWLDLDVFHTFKANHAANFVEDGEKPEKMRQIYDFMQSG